MSDVYAWVDPSPLWLTPPTGPERIPQWLPEWLPQEVYDALQYAVRRAGTSAVRAMMVTKFQAERVREIHVGRYQELIRELESL